MNSATDTICARATAGGIGAIAVLRAMETQSKEGMMTMEQHLLHLYQHGVISKESAVTYTNEASLIERLG